MKKQAGFAMFQVMMVAVIVSGVIYFKSLEQHVAGQEKNASRVATLVTPVLLSFIEYSIANIDPTQEFHRTYYVSNVFHDLYYTLSEDYGNDLKAVGYDYAGRDIEVETTYSLEFETVGAVYE